MLSGLPKWLQRAPIEALRHCLERTERGARIGQVALSSAGALAIASQVAMAQQLPFTPNSVWDPEIQCGSNDCATTSVALGDVDADGDLDAVFGNGPTQPNFLYLNQDGNLLATPSWDDSPGVSTRSIALGDVNNDGYLDLVAGNTGSPNTLSLFDPISRLFMAPGLLPDTLSTNSVALGDIDDDGDLDLVCGNIGQVNTVYPNVDGSFSTEVRLDLARDTWVIALGDMDGDDDLDIVEGISSSDDLIYENDGNGNFTVSSFWAPNQEVRTTSDIVLGDVNGDGRLDIVCGNQDGQNHVYLNKGDTDPRFSARPDTIFGPQRTNSLDLGDLDSDGVLDVVCGRNGFDNEIYENLGGAFSLQPAWVSVDQENQTKSSVFGDIDGDGDLDLVCGNDREKNTLYMNLQVHLLPSRTDWIPLDSRKSQGVALGDVDNDGDLDLACGNETENTLYLFEAGSFSDSLRWRSDAPNRNTTSVAMGDVNRDGFVDLVCGNSPTQNTAYLNNDGTLERTPTWGRIGQGSPLENTLGIALADIDGNGYLDLVCANRVGENSMYYNEGDSLVFEITPSWHSAGNFLSQSVAVGDVDADGDLDVVFGNAGPNRLHLNELTEGGGLNLNREPTVWEGLDTNTHSVALGDVNGDGYLDVVCGNVGSENRVYLFESTEGDFSSNPEWSGEPGETQSVALGDVDADGDLDLIFGRGQENTIYMNTGSSPLFSQGWSSDSLEAVRTYSVVIDDVDADGDLDLACGNRSENSLYLGSRLPAFKGDPAEPVNQLPNNSAFLSFVQAERVETNLYSIQMTAFDVESDPLQVLVEYKYRGEPKWERVGKYQMVASPQGVTREFEWDVSLLPVSFRESIMRLRAISNPNLLSGPPSSVSRIQRVAGYLKSIGTVQVQRAVLAVSPGALTFGTMTVGDVDTLTFDIFNQGNLDLIVQSVEPPSPEQMRIEPVAFTLQPGQTQSVRVFLEPTTQTDISGDIQVWSNDSESPMRIPVTTNILDLTVQTRRVDESPVLPLCEAIVVIVTPDDDVNVDRGSILYRDRLNNEGNNFTEAALEVIGEDVFLGGVGKIPGSAVSEAGVEYYIRVENGEVSRTDPPNFPDRLFSVQVAMDAEPMTIDASRSTDGDPITIEAILKCGVEFRSGLLWYRRGGESELAFQVDTLRAEGAFPSGTIPADFVTPRGIDYWVQVETLSDTLFYPPSQPKAMPQSLRVTTPNLQEDTQWPGLRYRIISIPLDFEDFQETLKALLSDQEEFGPPDSTVWRAFRYLDGENIELTTPGRESDFIPVPGRAFWLISRKDHRVNTSPIEGLSVATDSDYPIVLSPGWNQFGNPFSFPVAWGSVVLPDSMAMAEEVPLAFDPSLGEIGDFAEDPPAVLEPFEGYFIYNPTSREATLQIPPVEATLPVPEETDHESASAAQGGSTDSWRLELHARTSRAVDANNEFGVHPLATDGYDRLDWRKPPPAPGPWVQIAFVHRDWELRSGHYKRDFRSTESEGHLWHLEVRSQERGEEIAVDGFAEQSLPADFVIQLVDQETSASVQLHAGAKPEDSLGRYRFLSYGPKRGYRLTLLAGTEAYVSRERETLIEIPSVLVLDNSAPNPFNARTRIRFGLPHAQRVTLAIYDVRGRLRRHLLRSETRSEGFHTVIWDGTDDRDGGVESGVYFYRLTADSKSITRRMLVIK